MLPKILMQAAAG